MIRAGTNPVLRAYDRQITCLRLTCLRVYTCTCAQAKIFTIISLCRQLTWIYKLIWGIALCFDGTILSRWPTDAQGANPLATVLSFVFKFKIVMQHRHGLAIYGVRRKLGAASRDSLRNDTCILCGNCFNREIPRPQLDATNPASLVKYTNSPESLLILQSVTTVHFFSFFCDSRKKATRFNP